MMRAAPASAQELGSVAYYGLTEDEWRGHEQEWRVFMEYNNSAREPCQHYQPPPAGFVMEGCDLYRVSSQKQVAQTTQSYADMKPAAGESTAAPPVANYSPATHSYVIYFDWDRSQVRTSEKDKINGAAAEITSSGATHVTVSGHADRSGPEDYNTSLSKRRADSVSAALSADGVRADIMENKAYGETMPAVPTADGVRNQQNRRVVIDIAQ